MRELALVEKVSDYLDARLFHTVTELPFLQRHVDIVGYESSRGALIAVEAKVKNWQCALRQAVTCLLFADEVYIAMPTEYIHRVDQSEIARFGIGLLEVNSRVIVVSKAVSSRYISDNHRKNVIDRVQWLKMLQLKGQYNASQ
jgi:hypothetical protein